jgi:dipeptide/tripeptide permease
MAIAYFSDKYHARGIAAIFSSILCMIGFIMFFCELLYSAQLGRQHILRTSLPIGSSSDSIRYASLFFSIPGSGSLQTCLSAWTSNNVTPHIRRATAIGIVFIAANLGGILATWLLGSLSPAPEYKSATLTLLVMSACVIVLVGVNMVYLDRENKKKEKQRVVSTREQEQRGLGDKSAWFVYTL